MERAQQFSHITPPPTPMCIFPLKFLQSNRKVQVVVDGLGSSFPSCANLQRDQLVPFFFRSCHAATNYSVRKKHQTTT